MLSDNELIITGIVKMKELKLKELKDLVNREFLTTEQVFYLNQLVNDINWLEQRHDDILEIHIPTMEIPF